MFREGLSELTLLCAQVHTKWTSSVFYFYTFSTQHLLILFCSICCVEGSVKANLSGGGELASGTVMVGPPGSLRCLARLVSLYAGNMAGSGRFVLVRCTDGICAAQRRWWGLRWCSVISAEGSSTSSPGRAEHPDREGERNYGTCPVNKGLQWNTVLLHSKSNNMDGDHDKSGLLVSEN